MFEIGFPPGLFGVLTRFGWMDALLSHRARDVLSRSGLSRHLPQSGLLLDVGSGTGHLSEAVLRRNPGRRCVSVDPEHAPPRRLAARMAGRAWHPLRADGRRLPFADSCFDGAWLGFVLHHVPPDAQGLVLNEVARVLRPGATLLLLEDTPSDEAERRTTVAADRRLNMEPLSAPHHHRSPEHWRRALPEHGFQVETEVAFTRLFPRATVRRVQHRAFVCRLDRGSR